MSKLIVMMTVVLTMLAVPACYLLPSGQSEHGLSASAGGDEGKGDRAEGGGGGAVAGLRWGGTLLTLTGLGIVASRFMGFLTAPLIGGVLTAGAGVATLTLADLMSRFWWIGPLLLLALIGVAVVEYLNERDLLWRDPPWSTPDPPVQDAPKPA